MSENCLYCGCDGPIASEMVQRRLRELAQAEARHRRPGGTPVGHLPNGLACVIRQLAQATAIITAQDDLLRWYEDDHDRWNRDDSDLPEDFLELERAVDAAKATQT